jgi:hypothetical protein
MEAIRTAMTTTQVHNGFFLKRTINTDQSIDYLVAMTNALKEKYLVSYFCGHIRPYCFFGALMIANSWSLSLNYSYVFLS